MSAIRDIVEIIIFVVYILRISANLIPMILIASGTEINDHDIRYILYSEITLINIENYFISK